MSARLPECDVAGLGSRPGLAPTMVPGGEDSCAADHLVSAMEFAGVRAAFGITGGSLGTIFDRLCGSRVIEVFHGQHEGGAAFAAMGRAMACRGKELPVCFSTAGPGATNLITGVAAAYEEGVPLFVLTGNSPSNLTGRGALQDSHPGGVDIVRMFESITVASETVRSSEALCDTFFRLAELALRHKRPVHMNVPLDLSNGKVDCPPFRSAPVRTQRLLPGQEEVLERFLQGARPLIFVGNGVKLSGLSGLLKTVAERHDLPVVCTTHGRGAMDEGHPSFVGTFGLASDGTGRAFFRQYKPDAVLFLGTGLGEMATAGWSEQLMIPALRVHVDIDESKFDRAYRMSHNIRCDIAEVLTFLQQQIAKGGRRRPTPVHESGIEPVCAMPEERVHPQHLVRSLTRALPAYSSVFCEMGNTMAWAMRHADLLLEKELMIPLGLSSMGSAIGAAVGAASVDDGRKVVCLTGDCAAMMHGNELKTAVEYELPVTFIVLNDGGHGMVQHGSRLVGLKNIDVRFKKQVKFDEFARSLGARALRARSTAEWNSLLNDLPSVGTGPLLVDVWIDAQAVPPIGERARVVRNAQVPIAAEL